MTAWRVIWGANGLGFWVLAVTLLRVGFLVEAGVLFILGTACFAIVGISIPPTFSQEDVDYLRMEARAEHEWHNEDDLKRAASLADRIERIRGEV